MIACVITNVGCPGLPPAHDAPGAPVTRTWCCDCVFAVVAPFLLRQQTLAVSKNDTVFFMCKRTTLVDQLVGPQTLTGQFGDRHHRGRVDSTRLSGLHQTGAKNRHKRKASKH